MKRVAMAVLAFTVAVPVAVWVALNVAWDSGKQIYKEMVR